MNDIERRVANMMERLKDMRLTLYCGDPDSKISMWVMSTPGKNEYATQLTFGPFGIALQGDFYLGANGHGMCSEFKYGLEWFVRQGQSGYLCGRFMKRDWHEGLAEQGMKDFIESIDSDVYEEGCDHLLLRDWMAERIEDGRCDFGSFDYMYSQMIEVAPSIEFEDIADIGIGYDPQQVVALFSIQQKFRELYLKRKREEEESAD